MLVPIIYLLTPNSNHEAHIYYPCTEFDACKDPKGKIYFLYEGWTQKYNLTCSFEESRSLGKTAFLVMNTLSCFLTMLLIDLKGRKFTAIAASSIIICMVFFATIFDNWYFKMVCLGIANGCEGCFSNLFNLMMNETSCKIPKKLIR